MAKDIKPDTLADIERRHIGKTLKQCSGNITKTAIALGVDRRTLYRKVQAYGWMRKRPPARFTQDWLMPNED